MMVIFKNYRKLVKEIRFSLKSDKNDGYFKIFSKICRENSIFIKI